MPIARAVLNVTQEYHDSRLTNDPAPVMATLTRDAPLLQSSVSRIQGMAAINACWHMWSDIRR